MDADHRQQAKRLFQAAVDLPPEQQARFLAEQCGSDEALREDVEKLLGASESVMGDFLHTPVVASRPRIEEPDAAMPEAIGQYRILRRLGEGGMGVVYEAEQEKTGSIVALKVIRPGLASRELLRRFEHEAQVLGRLRHAGIAQIYEAGIQAAGDTSVLFIAMELIDGPSLLEYVKSESPDVRTILRLFAMICDAVHHAHQKGVIHRDIKPGNILVERAGQSVQPKILDFGIARVTDSDTLTTTLQTHTGQLIGTVKYMSPEQAAGDPRDIDTRSDVYALGVILYELLGRRMPYEVDHKLIHEAVRVIREDEARPLSSVSRLYRGDLTTIVGKALEKDKARRYQSASELATDIRRYLNDEPITAHPPSATYQLRKFARRNRGLVSGVAIMFVLLVSGIIATSWQAAAASHARQAEQKQRERAERRFKEVRNLAHSLVFEFDDRIRWLAGSTPARELLVKRGLEYLNSIAEDIDPDDVQLQDELGEAYFRLGDVQGDPSAPNLGDPAGALKSYLTGLPFLEAIAEAHPDKLSPPRAVGLAYNRIGQLLMSMGRREEAGEYYQRARGVLAQLHRAFPQDLTVLRALGNCYDIQATAHKLAGRLEDARQAELQALKTLRAALDLEPGHMLTRHAVASVNSQLGGILEMQGKPADALKHRRECLTILESLVDDEPHNAVFRRSVGVAADSVGLSYKLSGHYEPALSYFQRAIEIAEQLPADDANYELVQADLLRAYTHLGEAQLTLGRKATASETFHRHLELCRQYAEQHEKDAGAQRQLGVAFYKLAEVDMARAKDESLTDGQRREHWRNAGGWFRKCHAVFIDMRDRKILAESDRGVPDEIDAEIAMCKAQLATLTSE